MTEALKHPVRPVLLHIASSAMESSEALAVEQWIVHAGMEVGRCPDVYLGLARALGSASGDLRAVVVCVEDLSTDEFEFFSLLARARRDLPVFVYGTRSPERIVRALQSGAKELATRDAMLALRARLERPAPLDESTSSPQPPAPAATKDVDSSPAAGLLENIEDEPREDADSVAAARVPWLRYSGGPERQRPSASKAEREETSSTGGMYHDETNDGTASHDCERGYEPLLTEQELAALLGDDFDDIAIQEREMLTGEGEVPGSGMR